MGKKPSKELSVLQSRARHVARVKEVRAVESGQPLPKPGTVNHLLHTAAEYGVRAGDNGGLSGVKRLLKKFRDNVPQCPRCMTRRTREIDGRYRCRDCGTWIDTETGQEVGPQDG